MSSGAAIDWQAILAAIGGLGVIVSLALGWIALQMARSAKTQAEASVKQAEIAEREHARATEPRLRVGT